MSQWRVDDAATATLMVSFYQALGGGDSAAQALATAQRNWLKAEGTVGRRHPFFWAAFQVIGKE
jgi:CHAT domain-containing protein